MLIHDERTGDTASIDAPDAAAVMRRARRKGLALTHILATHHHADHTAGNLELKHETGCTIIGPKARGGAHPGSIGRSSDGDTIRFGGHDRSRARHAGPHHRPHQLLDPGAPRRLRRRHAVRHGLRARARGQPRDDVGVPQEARRPAARHRDLLRPRVHARQCPVRPHHRAGERGARQARAARWRRCAPKASRRCRPGSRSSSRPTFSCAPTARRSAFGSECRRRPTGRSSAKCASERTGRDGSGKPRCRGGDSRCSGSAPPRGRHFRETFRDSATRRGRRARPPSTSCWLRGRCRAGIGWMPSRSGTGTRERRSSSRSRRPRQCPRRPARLRPRGRGSARRPWCPPGIGSRRGASARGHSSAARSRRVFSSLASSWPRPAFLPVPLKLEHGSLARFPRGGRLFHYYVAGHWSQCAVLKGIFQDTWGAADMRLPPNTDSSRVNPKELRLAGVANMKAQSTGPLLSTIFVDYDNIYLSLKRKNEDAAQRFAKDSASGSRKSRAAA